MKTLYFKCKPCDGTGKFKAIPGNGPCIHCWGHGRTTVRKSESWGVLGDYVKKNGLTLLRIRCQRKDLADVAKGNTSRLEILPSLKHRQRDAAIDKSIQEQISANKNLQQAALTMAPAKAPNMVIIDDSEVEPEVSAEQLKKIDESFRKVFAPPNDNRFWGKSFVRELKDLKHDDRVFQW